MISLKASTFGWTPNIIKEKIVLAPNSCLLGPSLGHKLLLGGFSSTRCQLNIVPSCNPVEYQGKLMMQTSCDFYLYQLDIVPSYYLIQFKGKLKNQTSENDNKPNFGSDFRPFGLNLGPFFKILSLLVAKYCSKLSSYAIYSNTNEPNLRKWQKQTN